MTHSMEYPDMPTLSQESRDTRPPALGLGRLVMVVYWVFGLVTTAIAVYDIYTHRDLPRGAQILALIAGLIYLVAASGITHNGRRMRMLGWASVILCAAGPVIVGLAGIGLPELAHVRSAWADFGHDFFYLPLAIVAVGIAWMWRSNPRRIVEIAEQIERVPLVCIRRR